MRVTTLFNRLLDLPSTTVRDVSFTDDGIEVLIRSRQRRLRCPCGYSTHAAYDQSRRRWRHLDIGTHRLWLAADIRRLHCPDCGVRTEDVAWARPRARHTRDFEDVVAWLAQRTDKTTVSTLLRCSWDAVSNIIARVVADHLDEQRMHGLYRIGVDEICYRHPTKYLTVVGDHHTRRVVWVGKGRNAATFEEFFDAAGETGRSTIEAISMDMSPAYHSAAAFMVPKARLCCDGFHIIQWANQALDAVYSAHTGGPGQMQMTVKDRRILRWTLRRGREHLPEERAALVNTLRRERYGLFRAWELKEQLRALYRGLVAPADAAAYLKKWCTAARRSKLPPFIQLASKIARASTEIVAAIELGLSNGLIEGINSKIRLINARGYGHHSSEALTSMIYLCLGGIDVKLPTQT